MAGAESSCFGTSTHPVDPGRRGNHPEQGTPHVGGRPVAVVPATHTEAGLHPRMSAWVDGGVFMATRVDAATAACTFRKVADARACNSRLEKMTLAGALH